MRDLSWDIKRHVRKLWREIWGGVNLGPEDVTVLLYVTRYTPRKKVKLGKKERRP